MKRITLSDEPTLLALVAIGLAAVALWAMGCGGGGVSSPSSPSSSSSSSSSTSTPGSSSSTGGVTVTVVGSDGSGAFSPNPVQAAAGTSIVWKNNSGLAHHLVMDNGTLIGDLAPNASITVAVSGSGGSFHCTTHPSMVGSINGSIPTSSPSSQNPTPDPYAY